jgi:hypothetical protein
MGIEMQEFVEIGACCAGRNCHDHLQCFRKNPKTTGGHRAMAVTDALEDRLSFCSNSACQNGPHNLRLILNFGFFVRGF